MKHDFDIDIDFGDREKILSLIQHAPASKCNSDIWSRHNTGVYVNPIPYDAVNGWASIDFKEAEDLGYLKFDLLNVSVYTQVKDEQHLNMLLATEPMWEMLEYKEFVEKVIHIGNHFNTLRKMPEEANTLARMAMFLAVIRPAKRSLIGKPWKEVALTVWEKPADGSYSFKKSHAVAYAHLVGVHMNLLCGL